jgi:hypothetical protein
VIAFNAQPPVAVEKKIKASKRDLLIGDDFPAVRAVLKAVADVQYEGILEEGMAVARSRKWETIMLATRVSIEEKLLKELVGMYPTTPVVFIASKLPIETHMFYYERGCMAGIVASDITDGRFSLCKLLDNATEFKVSKQEDADETKQGALVHSRFNPEVLERG